MESAALADETERCQATGCHEKMPESKARCPNFYHRRTNAPVRFCSQCGDVVNDAIPIRQCTEEAHTVKRRNRQKYCVDCGEPLVRGRCAASVGTRD